uniref:Uncharacterized protein n=1 Tax=Populus trichocarpa TaxID=3694 RepID=A9P9N5_POPTR|nr:unknown [Populus trichocarpa]
MMGAVEYIEYLINYCFSEPSLYFRSVCPTESSKFILQSVVDSSSS